MHAAAESDVDALVAEYERLYEVAPELKAGGARHESLRYSARIELGLSERGGEGTEVSLTSDQTLRGMSRLGSPMMRSGQARILEEALDGIERALVARP